MSNTNNNKVYEDICVLASVLYFKSPVLQPACCSSKKAVLLSCVILHINNQTSTSATVTFLLMAVTMQGRQFKASYRLKLHVSQCCTEADNRMDRTGCKNIYCCRTFICTGMAWTGHIIWLFLKVKQVIVVETGARGTVLWHWMIFLIKRVTQLWNIFQTPMGLHQAIYLVWS